MKQKINGILIAIIATALVAFTAFMTVKTIDEKLKNRLPETTETETTETETETEIIFESIEETEDETEIQPILTEESDAEVSESSSEIQPSLEEISDVHADAYAEPITEYTEPTYTEPVATYDAEITAIAQTLWGECRGCSTLEKAAVVWCILNRVDDPTFPNTIYAVVSAPYQFQGYSPYNPIDADLYAISEDVLARWYAEKNGAVDVGRVLPKEYCYFEGDGYHNHFVTSWKGSDYWMWSLPSPYGD